MKPLFRKTSPCGTMGKPGYKTHKKRRSGAETPHALSHKEMSYGWSGSLHHPNPKIKIPITDGLKVRHCRSPGRTHPPSTERQKRNNNSTI